MEATYDLVVLDPTFETTVEVFDPETRCTTRYRVGADNAGDQDKDGQAAPLPSFSPPFRLRPVDRLNPVLVAMALHDKFKAYEFDGAEIAPQCLPYKQKVLQLVKALNYKLPPPPNITSLSNETIHSPSSIESDEEFHSSHSASSIEQ